jgi:two-component system response regulator (stage 0 sporulation protein F)
MTTTTTQSTMTILIVDDEKDVEFLYRQKFRKELREGKLTLYFAFSGAEALEQMHKENLPLVFSDINMPGMTGLELLRIIKSEQPDTKVCMVTAYGDKGSFDKAMEFGADGFFTKPVNFDSLKEKIFGTI